MEVYVLATVVIIVALIFDGVNGFHDAANAIATAITTGALKAKTAIIMAAVMNLIGALMGTAVAAVIARDIVNNAGERRATVVLGYCCFARCNWLELNYVVVWVAIFINTRHYWWIDGSWFG
ncbi:inorganic phosphate transporter [Weissella sp. LMG 11983]|uniref:inorganic phosphate transporter n=1 Tax=Weissella sp. LMG 11983 TaxID=2987700 RepID=UPI0039B637DD